MFNTKLFINGLTFLAVILLGINASVFSQSYQFSRYSIEQGLPQQYIYSINQDNNGFIWIGTGDGISKFDGIEFQNYTTEDGLAENFISCSAQLQKNIIWIGHNKGGISRISNGKIETIVSDSLVDSKITDIIIDQDNYVWATSQNGYLIKISPKLIVKKFDLFANQKNIYAIAGRIEDNILIGTDDGLFKWKLNQQLEPHTFEIIKSLKHQKIECISKSKFLTNNFWIGTSETGLHQLKYTNDGKILTRHYNDEEINLSGIQHIEEDENKNLWLSTYSGLYKLVYADEQKGIGKVIRFGEENGIGNFVKTSFVDREGNTWIGMYGEGLAMLKDEIFTYYNHSTNKEFPNDTRSFLFRDSTKWYGLSKGLLKVNSNGEKKYFSSKNGFKDVAVNNIIGRGEELFVGTDGEGLFRFNTKTEKFTKEFLNASNLTNNINKMVAYVNDLWVATEGGLIKINLTTKQTQLYNTLTGLRHNSVYDIFMLKDGSLVITSHSNELTIIKDEDITYKMVDDIDQLMDIVAIEADTENNLWLATLGNGVYKQEADSFLHISTVNGLKSDYCYSIISDNKNGIWVGHRGALSRISTESLLVEIFDSKKGINVDFNKGATYTDKEKNIWFGTNEKLIKFNPKKFLKNTIPPAVSIKSVILSDKEIPISDNIELPYDLYKLKINFIGISFKQPEGVKYQYFLEGYDLDWSESSSNNFANYSRIEDGSYTFYVKACNNDGFCSEETLAFKITVAAPFWKKWWFILILFVSAILLVYFIIKAREKRQKEIQKTLEIELSKRTKEVVKKSEEIEEKNKNITDSINYALKIQKSILPSKSLMKKLYPESFVFYKPRDIVSGDFYWYEKIDNKFIVACADCTGHGVPGAFMSMISSTLFKEIAHQYKITEPSEFLYKLDELLNSTLKKSKSSKIHDGLDMSLCVFDLENNNVQFSGAYRPFIVCSDNKLVRYKTTPFSIGGDDYVKKEFNTINLELKKGDIVYLFTDGYPDQFGGERGKKLYLRGFEAMLEKLLHLEMEEQSKSISQFFKDWKKNHKQIDDVLVMGIKIN